MIRGDIPSWLHELILRCLEVDAGARHATAGQLAFDLQHPDGILLTERARAPQVRFAAHGGDALLPYGSGRPMSVQTCSRQLAGSPIVMAAVDLSADMESLAEALRLTIRRMLQTEPSARLACLNVLKLALIALDEFEVEHGRNRHLQGWRN